MLNGNGTAYAQAARLPPRASAPGSSATASFPIAGCRDDGAGRRLAAQRAARAAGRGQALAVGAHGSEHQDPEQLPARQPPVRGAHRREHRTGAGAVALDRSAHRAGHLGRRRVPDGNPRRPLRSTGATALGLAVSYRGPNAANPPRIAPRPCIKSCSASRAMAPRRRSTPSSCIGSPCSTRSRRMSLRSRGGSAPRIRSGSITTSTD